MCRELHFQTLPLDQQSTAYSSFDVCLGCSISRMKGLFAQVQCVRNCFIGKYMRYIWDAIKNLKAYYLSSVYLFSQSFSCHAKDPDLVVSGPEADGYLIFQKDWP